MTVRPTLHHLTPQGWIERDDPPADRQLTYRRTAEISASEKPSISYALDWLRPGIMPAELTGALRKFGVPEEHVRPTVADVQWESIAFG